MASKHVITLSAVINFFAEDLKAFAKGENSVASNHVQSMEFDADFMNIKGTVHASMKNKIYKVQVSLDKEGKVQVAQCSCPKGIVCHHIAALLIFAHYNISVTDKNCSWRNTSTKSNQVITCEDMYPSKSYKAIERKITTEELTSLKEGLSNIGTTIGVSWLLQEDNQIKSLQMVPYIDNLLISKEFIAAKNKEIFMREKCFLSAAVIKEVAESTKGQNSNENWHIIRKHRLTSSHFGSILSAVKRNRFPESLFKSLLGIFNLDGVKAIQWGRTHEKIAIDHFEEEMKIKVLRTGIFLSENGFIGASPDGLVGEDAIIEVKCPYSYRNDILQERLKNVKDYIIYFNDDNEIFINGDHHYYDQIQGILHILKRTTCYLVIWTTQSTVIVTVGKDPEWTHNLEIIEKFYFNNYIPKILENINC